MHISENELKRIASEISNDFEAIESFAMKLIAEKIGKILKTENAIDYVELKKIYKDIKSIDDKVDKTIEKSEKKIYNMLKAVSLNEYNEIRKDFKDLTPFSKNFLLNKSLLNITDDVHKEIRNYSKTTGFASILKRDGVIIKEIKKPEWQPLEMFYQNLVDKAIIDRQLGVETAQKTIQRSIREMANSGLSFGTDKDDSIVIEYPTGYKRRLDTSIKQAINGGQKRLLMEQDEIIGKEIGADGKEISFHLNPRPGHLDFSGKQYNMVDYQRICEPLLNEYGCLHYAFSIVLGISEPALEKEQLEKFKKESMQIRTYKNKQYTGYEATQKMRYLETQIRKYKDRAIMFNGIQDKEAYNKSDLKVKAYQREYNSFTKAMNMTKRPMNVKVAGYPIKKAS